ncbi:hypothetical protein [Kaistella sp.]
MGEQVTNCQISKQNTAVLRAQSNEDQYRGSSTSDQIHGSNSATRSNTNCSPYIFPERFSSLMFYEKKSPLFLQ